MLIGAAEPEVTSILETSVTHVFQRVGEKPCKIQRCESFLGPVAWGMLRHSVSPTVKDVILALTFPTTKKEIQYLVGLFEFYRQHVPNLEMSLQPIYWVTQKPVNFKCS